MSSLYTRRAGTAWLVAGVGFLLWPGELTNGGALGGRQACTRSASTWTGLLGRSLSRPTPLVRELAARPPTAPSGPGTAQPPPMR